MKAPDEETKQVSSALLQKFRPKINIADYGGAASCHSWASTAKTVSPTSEIRPSVESQQDFLHCYVYIVYVK